MALLLIALIIAFAAATGLVLADSGLRLWSAFDGVRAQQTRLRGAAAGLPIMRAERAAATRVTTRISYAEPPLRAVA